MEGNLLDNWKTSDNLDAEKLVNSDLDLGQIRRKIESKTKREKIDLAYRLATSTINTQTGKINSSSKLNTIITRLVKLIRLYERAKQKRGYTEVKE